MVIIFDMEMAMTLKVFCKLCELFANVFVMFPPYLVKFRAGRPVYLYILEYFDPRIYIDFLLNSLKS